MAITKKTARKTAKKAPAKKAATKKRAYNRKAPVKKRAYNRKPKDAQPVAEVVTDTLADDTAVKQDQATAGEDQQAESTGAILSQIEVIDMRGTDPMGRIALLSMLDNEGYINEQLESPLNEDTLRRDLFADALRLNHTNKIVSFAEWDQVSGSRSISRTFVQHSTQIGFSRPEADYQDTIKIGNALYIRVG